METYGDLKNLINLIQTKKKNSKIKGVAIDTIIGNIPGIGYVKSAFDFYKAAIKTPDDKRPNSWLKRLDVDDEMSAIVDDKVENGFLQSATKTFEKQPDDKKLNPDFDMNQEMIKYLDSKYSGRTLTGVPSFNLVKEDALDKFLRLYSYKFPKGHIDINNPQDVLLLENILNKLNISIQLNEEVPNKLETIKAVQKIVDKVGKKYDLFIPKSKKNRLSKAGKQETQFFVDIFQDVFDTEKDDTLDIKITPPKKSPNPSNSFNMYSFKTDEFGEVNIVVSNQPPGGAGKKNEAEFIDGLNNLIQVNGGSANIKLTSPELTLNFKNINEVIDSSKTGAGKGDKSDAQFISDGDVKANISLKQDGGFRWASVASNYKEFITKLVNKALKGELESLTLKPNPDNPKKFLMFDPKTGNRITKVVIPDFPKDDVESWVFGPEEPRVIMVSKTWSNEDFTLDNGNITARATHIYQTLDDIEKDNIDPVFAIMQHVGMSQGLDYRIIPAKQAKITKNVRELSYSEIMS